MVVDGGDVGVCVFELGAEGEGGGGDERSAGEGFGQELGDAGGAEHGAGGCGEFGQAIGGEEEEPGLLIVVHCLDEGRAAQLRPYKYTLPVVAAALLNYCFTCRIPVPRKAQKSIEVMPEGFVLTLHTSAEMVRRHAALPRSAPGRSGPGLAMERVQLASPV